MQKLADKKKKENIGEYIIYMYQMEDLLRSYQFNMEEVKQYVISHYPVDEAEKAAIYQWFEALATTMQQENLQEQGHLSATQDIVDQLAAIHWQLLKEDKEYFALYHQAKPHIINSILAAEGRDMGHEIQLCLNGIYGLLLCRLTGKKLDKEQEDAAQAFGGVLSYLNLVYLQREQQEP